MALENEQKFEQENASLQNEFSFEDENLAVGRQKSGSKLIKHGPKRDWVIDVASMMKNVEPPLSPARYICRVSHKIREVNKGAYTPIMVAIGPLHHGQKNLKEMEEMKNIYLKHFLQRAAVTRLNELGNGEHQKACQWKDDEIDQRLKDCDCLKLKDWDCLKHFRGILQRLEGEVRKTYGGNLTHFTSDNFVTMILVDAAFIIELLLRFHFRTTTGDTILSTILLEDYVRHDLMLLENQLPFFILRELYQFAFGSYSIYPSFFQLARKFFSAYIDIDQNKSIEDDPDVKHFTDLLRTLLLPPKLKHRPPSSPKPGQKIKVDYLHRATRLHAAGVKLKPSSSKDMFEITFSNGRLEIPCLSLTDYAESIYRNLMAWEQYHYPYQAFICDYMVLMNNLINTTKDADLLEEKKIIKHYLGDSGEVASLFNKLCTNVIKGLTDRHYSGLCRDLNNYFEQPWHTWRATLMHTYFSTPWIGASTIAAIILLVLTLLQTILSILDMLLPVLKF